MKIALTNVNYASKIKPAKSKRENFIFCLLTSLLLLGLLISPAAAATEWKLSPSNPVVGDTLKITGTASPGENIRAEVTFEKKIPVSGGRYQLSLNKIKIPDGKDNLFSVRAEGVRNLHVGVKKLIWINLNSDASKGVVTISQAHVPAWTYDVLIDGDALSGKSPVSLRVSASQTLKADSKGKFEFSYGTSSMPEGKFNIKIGKSEKTIELKYRQQKPAAEFSAVPTSGYTPLKVTFTDKSTGSPNSYKWNFGDGKSSKEKNPVHIYDRAGKYTVSLTATNDAGSDTETKSSFINVNVLKPPVAGFSADKTSGYIPLKVTFTDKSTGSPNSWKWDFGNGRSSKEKNPIHIYDRAGKYTVSLKVTNGAGSNTATKSSYIDAKVLKPPIAAFSASITSGKAPFIVKFTDKSTGSPNSWKWNFGDESYSTSQNPRHMYFKAGKYTVTLTARNAAGGTKITKSRYITVSKSSWQFF